MLLLIGCMYYYMREEHFTGYNGTDVGFAIIAALSCFVIHFVFNIMLNA
jgi:hypothetical protein